MREYETREIAATLRNVAMADVQCQRVAASFWFTEVLNVDGTELQFPHTIERGASRTYLLRVRPQEFFGILHEQVTAEVASAGAAVSAMLELDIAVSPTWRALPSAVILPRSNGPKPSEAVVDVYDGSDEPGIEMGDLSISDERLVSASIEKLPQPFHAEAAPTLPLSVGSIPIKEGPSIWKYRFSIRFCRAAGASEGPRYGFARLTSAASGTNPPLVVRVALE
jgi:hypothetical protein